MANKLNLDRRKILQIGVAGSLGTSLFAATPNAASAQTSNEVRVHRIEDLSAFPVNGYIVEGPDAVAVIDATITVPGAQAIRARVGDIGKPLAGVLLTHVHPDHYAGIGIVTAGLDVPIVALSEVNDIVRAQDEARSAGAAGFIGDLYPTERVFPNQTVADGAMVDLGTGLVFEVRDYGQAESMHDTVIVHAATGSAFVGDIVYDQMHAFMVENTVPTWRNALDRLRSELVENMVLYVGHGAPVTPAFTLWQSRYFDAFEAALEAVNFADPDAAAAQVTERMQAYLPSDVLLTFMQLSITPNAQRLGLIET